MFADTASGQEAQVIVFQLSGQDYGVDIGAVRQIIQVQNVTPIANTSDFIRGVINLREEAIPVVDLCRHFGIKSEDFKKNRIIIVNVDGVTVGLVVDSVSELLRFSKDSIQSPPALMQDVNVNYLWGIVLREDNSLIILLDLNKLLSAQEKLELSRLDNI